MSTKAQQCKRWIAVDWGTTNLRIWVMGGNRRTADHRSSGKGMGVLRRDAFEPAIIDLISEFLIDGTVMPVGVCGMAGSREGWADAGYLSTPCAPPDAGQAVVAPTGDPRISVRILPGIKQIDPPDVMRGEETQIAGFLSKNAGFKGVICLPGTHTKWVSVAAGKILNFQTFMTGEVFSLLSKSSVLRHIVSSDGWDDQAFATALTRSMNSPGMPVGQLFSLRAEALIAHLPPREARARLSGNLIGAELSAARPYWAAQSVVIIGNETVARPYRDALGLQNANLVAADADAMTLAGLEAAFESKKETGT